MQPGHITRTCYIVFVAWQWYALPYGGSGAIVDAKRGQSLA